MKIVKRDFASPLHNFTLWMIPTFTYIGLKAADAISPRKEWIWWVAIPTLICLWGILNWKIKK